MVKKKICFLGKIKKKKKRNGEKRGPQLFGEIFKFTKRFPSWVWRPGKKKCGDNFLKKLNKEALEKRHA